MGSDRGVKHEAGGKTAKAELPNQGVIKEFINCE